MTGPQEGSNTRPISVAELLAKNGTVGAPVTGRRRRRRGSTEAVTVAELTGEIPVIDTGEIPVLDTGEIPAIEEDVEPDEIDYPGRGPHAGRANGAAPLDAPVRERADRTAREAPYWSEPQPRWPESPPPRPRGSRPGRGESQPERNPFPLPTRHPARIDARRSGEWPEGPEERNGAEEMNPDPLEDYVGMSVDVMDTDVRDAEFATEDSAYVRSYLRSPIGRSVRGRSAAGAAGDAAPRRAEDYRDIVDVDDEDYPEDVDDDLADEVEDSYAWPDRTETVLHGGMIVLQSIVAVAFGAGLFLAFDELWRWNNIVALVLSVLVILGLVVGVRVVRKTEDITSTLIAVAVGALVTLGPLALLQSG
jgi:hypothetical protein